MKDIQGNGATHIFQGIHARTDVRTDSHVTTFFFLDRWATKFSKVWGSAGYFAAASKIAYSRILPSVRGLNLPHLYMHVFILLSISQSVGRSVSQSVSL